MPAATSLTEVEFVAGDFPSRWCIDLTDFYELRTSS